MSAVVLIPSLGRGPADFDDLAGRLGAAGHKTTMVEPRAGATLHDIAADIAALIDEPAIVVGHAFGNRVARCLAADRPDLVRAVVLLGAGGKVHPSDEVLAAMGRVLDEATAPDDHLAALSIAFFAPGNDPSVWQDGWHRELARAQAAATRATPLDDWWGAGTAPVLVVQGLDDRCAVPENGRQLRDAHPDRVTLVEIEGAAHALLPEQPAAVAEAVLAYLATT